MDGWMDKAGIYVRHCTTYDVAIGETVRLWRHSVFDLPERGTQGVRREGCNPAVVEDNPHW